MSHNAELWAARPVDWSDLLTVPEVARLHRVSLATVRRWIQGGKLLAARRNGRYLIPRRAAMAMLAIVEPVISGSLREPRLPGW